MKAIWNGGVIAQCDDTVVVEGNHYFIEHTVNRACVQPSSTHTVCGWKGTASYYSVVADGRENPDACRYQPEPRPAAAMVKGRIAFWRGVRVVDDRVAQSLSRTWPPDIRWSKQVQAGRLSGQPGHHLEQLRRLGEARRTTHTRIEHR
jgi:uncharacterized protein (DUF427 family)